MKPLTSIILGSGLGGVADKIEKAVAIPFNKIPGFARSTAGGHRGQLILGELEDTPIVAMAGRFHRYEGWTIDQITFPVYVMASLGADRLIASNAAGGVNPKLRVGDIVVIRDHLNWIHGPSRIPKAQTRNLLGRRGNLYDPPMAKLAIQTSLARNFTAYQGTYLATLGPTYETRAEYRMMRRIGVDVVGMSTVPEVLAASAIGMRTLGLSMVSNVARPDAPIGEAGANHEEVLAAGKAAETKMESIVRAIVKNRA
ncbi:Purine nucleoside phosphorylase 1 [Planctomycetes bacterium CA13]|uniref:purine-nucleoside phosphorylase n=2 Tax=Novipirellula herctigrandis TaxID=2527986 RepID=A0A5C5Z5P7_9BACT|nr:Purine nucleoside phosphorylase 1 [Planctomycetes bacterium CA13]